MSGTIEAELGIPCVSLIGSQFVNVALNAHARAGYAELPLLVWPQEMLQGEIPARPSIEATIDEIIYDLTEWAPKISGKQTIKPEPETFVYEGVDYQDALNKMNDDFLLRRWGDGLPLLPATKERVEWLLTGIDLAPDEVISSVRPSGMLATARTVAISAAMAGARPEYMPVIIAGLKAANGRVGSSGTNPAVFTLVVNGPIAKEIGINSSWHVCGPTSVYPASGSIGRALMTLGHTAGRASPGTTNQTPTSFPGAYVGWVLAEAEDRSPWEPLNVERGLAPGTSTVACLSTQGSTNLWLGGRQDCVGDFLKKEVAPAISYPNWNFAQAGEKGVAAMLVIPPPAAQSLKAAGYSKQQVKEEIWKYHQVSLADWFEIATKDEGGKASPSFEADWAVTTQLAPWIKEYENLPPDTMVPLAASPNNYTIVVAGGELTAHWRWMQLKMSSDLNIVEIEKPANWEDILKKATKFWEGATF